MPQIRKKGAIFPIFADPSSPPRSSTVSSSSSFAPSNNNTIAAAKRGEKNVSPGKKRVVVSGGGTGSGASTKSRSSVSSSISTTLNSGSSGGSARRVLSSKTISQTAPSAISTKLDGKGVKAAGLGIEKVESKGEKKVGLGGNRAPASAVTMNTSISSSSSSSIGWEKPMLRKVKPVVISSSGGKVGGGLFQVFEDGSSTSIRNHKRDRLPRARETSSQVTSDPFAVSTRTSVSTDDKENLPPIANTSVTRSPLNLESLGDAILASSAAAAAAASSSSSSSSPTSAAEAREGLSPRRMELGYGRGRKAGKVLQAAWKECQVVDRGAEDGEEVLHDTPILENEVDPLLLPFGMTTPAKRTKVIHTRTASEDSPSKWSATVLASSTTTPLKRTIPAKTTNASTEDALVGLGFGLPMSGLDRRFQPDGPLADVSEAYGATRDVEPSGFRESSRRAHAQQASWSGQWGMDVSAYPTARRD